MKKIKLLTPAITGLLFASTSVASLTSCSSKTLLQQLEETMINE